jgi:hypothetical protein
MQHPNALTPATGRVARLLSRWERIGLGVRCAYNPLRPDVLLLYVQAGRCLSRLQPQREALIQRRMLELLLHTATDGALPWHWRAMCLEHTAWPLARLASLWRASADSAPLSPARLESRIRCAGEQLGLPTRAAP